MSSSNVAEKDGSRVHHNPIPHPHLPSTADFEKTVPDAAVASAPARGSAFTPDGDGQASDETSPDLERTQSTASNPHGSRPACFGTLVSECLFVLTTTFAIGQSSILAGSILTMTSYIGDDLGMNDAEVTWLAAGQTLAAGAFLLFFGRVADLFGRRMMLIGSMGSFSVLLLVIGFSQDALMAEVLLALAGLSCAAVVPPAIGKLGAVYDKPSRRKNRAFACFSAGNPLGFILGAFIAGVATEISTWRTSFWVMAVIYAAFTVAAWFTTPEDAEQKLGGFNLQTLKKFDFLGALLAVAGIGLFTAALTLPESASRGWKTPYVIVLLVLGLVLMAAFLYWQSVFKYPLMPLSVWRDRNFSLLVAGLCLGFYGFNGNFFWIALTWQRIYGDSPLMVAVKTLPAAVGGVLVNIAAALLMHRVSNKTLSVVAAASLVVSSTLLSATSTSISYWALSFPALLFAVLGADFAFCVTNMYVMGSLPTDQQSVGGGILQTATRLASTVGLGVQTSVFSSIGGNTGPATERSYRPYQATFWISLVGAVAALGTTCFLTIGRQGRRDKPTTARPGEP